MTEQLQTVLANPRSLKARHALADYWITINDPRGQMINNCLRELERDLTVSLGFLSSQYYGLLNKHENEWTAAIRKITSAYDFRLGLIASVAMSGDSLLTKGRELLALAPIIAFHIDPPFELGPLLHGQLLRNAVDLTFGESRDFDDSTAIALAESSTLRQLRILRLPEIGAVTSRGLSALANSKNLPDLISIEVTGNPCAHNGGVMRNDERDYYVCAAGEPFLTDAQRDMVLGSDPTVLRWPPLFDQYAWLP